RPHQSRPRGVVDCPGAGQANRPRPIPVPPMRNGGLASSASYRAWGPGDLATQWGPAEQKLVEYGEDVIRWGVHVHADLVDDHRLFRGEVALTQEGARRELTDHVQ